MSRFSVISRKLGVRFSPKLLCPARLVWLTCLLCAAAFCRARESGTGGPRLKSSAIPRPASSRETSLSTIAASMPTLGEGRRAIQRESDRARLDFVSPEPATHWAEISVEDARRLQGYGEIFLDTRGAAAFGLGHLEGSQCIPAVQADSALRINAFAAGLPDPYVPVIIYGTEPDVSNAMAEVLYDAGLQNVLVCRAGYRDLLALGFRSASGREPSPSGRTPGWDRNAQGDPERLIPPARALR